MFMASVSHEIRTPLNSILGKNLHFPFLDIFFRQCVLRAFKCAKVRVPLLCVKYADRVYYLYLICMKRVARIHSTSNHHLKGAVTFS